MIRFSNIIISSLIFSSVAIGQTDSSYLKTEELLDEILNQSDAEEDNSSIYEDLEEILRNPIDLNSASLDDILRIPLISAEQAGLIIKHRKKYGKFLSVDELNSIKDLPEDIIKKISPFFTAGKMIRNYDNENFFENLSKESSVNIRSRTISALEGPSKDLLSKYPGTPNKFYSRVMFQYSDKFRIGGLAEKDPGEKSYNDFTSFFAEIKNIGILKIAAAGNYSLEFGQGLALWSPYSFSKGANSVSSIKRKGRGIRSYTSADENRFFRGIAATVELGNIDLSFFYSSNNIDANIDSVSGKVFSMPITGYHRTENEIANRKKLNETIKGLNITFSPFSGLTAGLLYYNSSFNFNLFPSNIYDAAGSNFNYYSFYYDLFLDRFNLAGELCYNGSSFVSVNSIEFSISKKVSAVTSLRLYPVEYINLHGFGFGELNGKTQNEFGIYNGLLWYSPVGKINFYYDFFRFPYATYTNPQPSSGDELLLYYTAKPANKFEMRLRYKYENKEISQSTELLKKLTFRLKQSYRLEFIYKPNKKIRLKGKFEYNHQRIKSSNQIEEGFMFAHDIRFIPFYGLNIYGRISIFQTSSFNSAIYQFENDLTGIFSSRALYGKGISWYLLCRYSIMDYITVSAKYSELINPDQKLYEPGSIKSIELENKFGIQVDLNF